VVKTASATRANIALVLARARKRFSIRLQPSQYHRRRCRPGEYSCLPLHRYPVGFVRGTEATCTARRLERCSAGPVAPHGLWIAIGDG
jgi:hypothetical protein